MSVYSMSTVTGGAVGGESCNEKIVECGGRMIAEMQQAPRNSRPSNPDLCRTCLSEEARVLGEIEKTGVYLG